MAKQGQHQNDVNDQQKSRGHNNPSKSMTITTGTPKKKETYAQQAREHKDPAKQPQAQKNEWIDDTRDPRRVARPLRARLEQGATYIDLASDAPREFTATGDMVANRDHCYVLKSAVDYTLWNRLIGVENPERTGIAR